MTDQFQELRVHQLDQALGSFRSLSLLRPPREGWARTIRKALGMSQRQLAARMSVSTTAAQSAERNEVRGKIQIDSLKSLAEGLECELVYALVPRESIQGMLARRATQLAAEMVNRVSISMELEDQGVSEEERQAQIMELAGSLLRDRPKNFWDE